MSLAQSLRKRATPSERTVWNWLRNRALFGLKFRRQHPIRRYVLDFYCAELKLCIEVDGGVHERFAQAIHDFERTRELRNLGITVVRIRNEDVREQPTATWDFLVGAVVQVLCRRTGEPEDVVMRRLYEQWEDPSP